MRFGIPPLDGVEPALAAAFEAHARRLQQVGLQTVAINFEPFERAGRLLYEGPWLAERLAAVGGFLRDHPSEVLDVTRQVLEGGASHTAVDVYSAMDAVALLRRAAQQVFGQVDLIAVPSVPTLTTLAEVAADPLGANARLGCFTNFVDLLDLTALAVPGGRVRGVPVGVTLVGPDREAPARGCPCLRVGRGYTGCDTGCRIRFRSASRRASGSGGARSPGPACGGRCAPARPASSSPARQCRCTPVSRTRTAPSYRLYRLDDPEVAKPGLVPDEAGYAIEVEVYELDQFGVEGLARQARAPLSIGTVRLGGGAEVSGYVCDPNSVNGLEDISAFGGCAPTWMR